MLEQGRQNVKKLKQPEIAKTIEEIWSNGLKVDKARMKVMREERDDEREGATGKKRKRKEESDLAIRSKEWETAIDLVHTTVSFFSFLFPFWFRHLNRSLLIP